MSTSTSTSVRSLADTVISYAVPGFCMIAATMSVVGCMKSYRESDGTEELGLKAIRRLSKVSNNSSDNLAGEVLLAHEHERRMEERLQQESQDIFGEEESKVVRTKVVVRVPATSANLGPGFDTIGMALDIWNEMSVETSDKFQITAEGEGAKDMPFDESNLVCLGVRAAYEAAGKPVPTLKYHLKNRIPYARGLGSSSAAIVAGLIAGLVLAGHQLPAWGKEELLNLACKIEGHPDNVAPVIYGGIQLGIFAGDRWNTERVNVPPGMQCVCFIPNKIGKTSTARGVLSDKISRTEAVFNIGRVAWLINALSTNNLDQLQYGTQDALHQPQRGEKVYPQMQPLIDAALEAGACAAYLSGAGPTVMAFTSGAAGDIFTQRAKERVDTKVAAAMLAVAEKYQVPGKVFITNPASHGAIVTDANPPFSKGLLEFSVGGVNN